MTKTNGMVKDVITMQLTRKFGYFCDIQHFMMITKIMTDSILSGYIRFLGISHHFLEHMYSSMQYNLRWFIITYLTMLPM